MEGYLAQRGHGLCKRILGYAVCAFGAQRRKGVAYGEFADPGFAKSTVAGAERLKGVCGFSCCFFCIF